jgi:hypothetical protein
MLRCDGRHGTPHLMSASMMAPQRSSTADGSYLNAFAPFCRTCALSSVLASVSPGIAETRCSDVAPIIDMCDRTLMLSGSTTTYENRIYKVTSAAEPRLYSWGPARAPHAHTRSRHVRMLKVSTAAATSPEVMTTDSRSIVLVPPRPGCLRPFRDARRHQPHLRYPSQRFRTAGRRVPRRRLIPHGPRQIAIPPHLTVVQAMGHRGSRLPIARGHCTHRMDHVPRHGDGALGSEPPAVPDRRLVQGCASPLRAVEQQVACQRLPRGDRRRTRPLVACPASGAGLDVAGHEGSTAHSSPPAQQPPGDVSGMRMQALERSHR